MTSVTEAIRTRDEEILKLKIEGSEMLRKLYFALRVSLQSEEQERLIAYSIMNDAGRMGVDWKTIVCYPEQFEELCKTGNL